MPRSHSFAEPTLFLEPEDVQSFSISRSKGSHLAQRTISVALN